jgi:hypothetical protein
VYPPAKVAVDALTVQGMIAWATGRHWAPLVPIPVFFAFRVTT